MRRLNYGLALLSLVLGVFIIAISFLQRPALSLSLGLMIGVLLLINGSVRLWLNRFHHR